MCPACYSSLFLMVSGIATTTVGSASDIVVARQLRRDARLEKLKRKNVHERNTASSPS